MGLPFPFKCDWSACNASIAKTTSTKKTGALISYEGFSPEIFLYLCNLSDQLAWHTGSMFAHILPLLISICWIRSRNEPADWWPKFTASLESLASAVICNL